MSELVHFSECDPRACTFHRTRDGSRPSQLCAHTSADTCSPLAENISHDFMHMQFCSCTVLPRMTCSRWSSWVCSPRRSSVSRPSWFRRPQGMQRRRRAGTTSETLEQLGEALARHNHSSREVARWRQHVDRTMGRAENRDLPCVDTRPGISEFRCVMHEWRWSEEKNERMTCKLYKADK